MVDGGKSDDKSVFGNSQPGEAKPIGAVIVDDNLKKPDESVKAVEGEVKRQEPPVPHAPRDDALQNAADDKDGVHVQEKRQLMSEGEEKSVDVARKEGIALVNNAIDTKDVKVSEQEIDAELKRLEDTDKVFKS